MTEKTGGALRADAVVLRGEASFLRMKEEKARLDAEFLEAMRVRAEFGLPLDPTADIAPAKPAPPSQPSPSQEEVDAWFINYFRARHVARRPPPKRDEEAFPECNKAIGARVRQMVKAMRKLPREFKRNRGDRDR